MTNTKGLLAWATMRCVMYHLNKNIPYDGWKYGFKSSKLTLEKFHQSVTKTQQYGYAMVEREFPALMDLVKFWYPLFRLSYAKPELAVRQARATYKQMLHFVKYIETNLPSEMEPTVTIDGNGLPSIYNRSKRSIEEYFLVVGLFLKFPQLNNITCEDPLDIYSAWLKQIELDRQFVSLYINKDLVCTDIQEH